MVNLETGAARAGDLSGGELRSLAPEALLAYYEASSTKVHDELERHFFADAKPVNWWREDDFERLLFVHWRCSEARLREMTFPT
jgi:hypothetical protein